MKRQMRAGMIVHGRDQLKHLLAKEVDQLVNSDDVLRIEDAIVNDPSCPKWGTSWSDYWNGTLPENLSEILDTLDEYDAAKADAARRKPDTSIKRKSDSKTPADDGTLTEKPTQP